jgi:hypothetical protein
MFFLQFICVNITFFYCRSNKISICQYGGIDKSEHKDTCIFLTVQIMENSKKARTVFLFNFIKKIVLKG